MQLLNWEVSRNEFIEELKSKNVDHLDFLVVFEGKITSNRKLSKRLVFLHATPMNNTEIHIQLMINALHYINEDSMLQISTMLMIDSIGRFIGYPGLTRTGQFTLYVTECSIVKLQPTPFAVQRLMGLFVNYSPSFLSDEIVCDLLGFARKDQMDEMVYLFDEKNEDEFFSEAVRISRVLQGLPMEKINQRDKKLRLYEKDLMDTYLDLADEVPQRHVEVNYDTFPGFDPSKYLPNPNDIRRRTYIQKKKVPQIIWIIEQISNLISFSKKEGLIQILDIGGGRGDLSISLATLFPNNIYITVIDRNESSLEAGRNTAELHAIDNIRFICQDVTEFEPENMIDIVLGLHTCGGLSDLCMNVAWEHQASFLICPCCFCSNTELYNVDSYSFASLSEMKTMCKLAECDDIPDISSRAMHIINSMRVKYFEKRYKELEKTFCCELLTFDVEFSPRNMVLVCRVKSE